MAEGCRFSPRDDFLEATETDRIQRKEQWITERFQWISLAESGSEIHRQGCRWASGSEKMNSQWSRLREELDRIRTWRRRK
jgi:hypothetical protein